MEEREALLRGVFLDPADPLPRLVLADYLEERGEDAWGRPAAARLRDGRPAAGRRAGPGRTAGHDVQLRSRPQVS